MSDGVGSVFRRAWTRWDRVVPYYIRLSCLIWVFTKCSFQFYLCLRQRKVLNETRRIPRALFGRINQATFNRAKEYQKELLRLEMFSCFYWMFYEYWTVWHTGFTSIWFGTASFLENYNIWPDNWDQETGESIFFIIFSISFRNTWINVLEIYRNFVIEERYGFNRMSFLDFVIERLTVNIGQCLWAVPVGVSILWIVRTAGKFFFLYVWLFSSIMVIGTVAIYPNLIAPIFNKYTSLRDGRLRMRLHRLARYVGFPLDDILVKHQDWQSGHPNAYFYGLANTKRIVLTDTLLYGYSEADDDEREVHTLFHNRRSSVLHQGNVIREPSAVTLRTMSAQSRASLRAARPRGRVSRVSMSDTGFNEYEIEAIVAKQMGHWRLGHSVYKLVVPELSIFFFFFIFSFLYQNGDLYEAFEVPLSINKPIILGLRLLLMDVMNVYTLLVEQAMRHVSRRMEYQADIFATRLGYGDDLIDAIIELNKENLGYPYFDTWYWNYKNSTPSLLQRIERIEEEMIEMERRSR